MVFSDQQDTNSNAAPIPMDKNALALMRAYLSQQSQHMPVSLQFSGAPNVGTGIGQALTNAGNLLLQHREQQQREAQLSNMLSQMAASQGAQANAVDQQYNALGMGGFQNMPKEIQLAQFNSLLAEHKRQDLKARLKNAFPGMSDAEAEVAASSLSGTGADNYVKSAAAQSARDALLKRVAAEKLDLNSQQGRAAYKLLTGEDPPETTAQLGTQQSENRIKNADANVAEGTQQAKIDAPTLANEKTKSEITGQNLDNATSAVNLQSLPDKNANDVRNGQLTGDTMEFNLGKQGQLLNLPGKLFNEDGSINFGAIPAVSASGAALTGQNPGAALVGSLHQVVGGKPAGQTFQSMNAFSQQHPITGFSPVSSSSVNQQPSWMDSFFNAAQQTPQGQQMTQDAQRNSTLQNFSHVLFPSVSPLFTRFLQ